MLLTVSFSRLGLYPACSGPAARITDAAMALAIKAAGVAASAIVAKSRSSSSDGGDDVGGVALGGNANRATVPTL